jgi:hypothetical protein
MREIDCLIRPLMSDDGFRLRGTTWYRIKKDFIQVLNFQKSLYGNVYYLNLAFDFSNDLSCFPSEYKFLPEYRYPIRIRAEHIPFLDTSTKEYIFDINSSERIKNIIVGMIERCLVFLNEYSEKGMFFSYFQDNPHLSIVWKEKQKLIEEGFLRMNHSLKPTE